MDLLRVVGQLQTPDTTPGTKEVGQLLLKVWKERGGTYSWHASAWHGTNPYADELRDAGLLEVHVGMASFHRRDQPAETPDQYGLSLTDVGRQILTDAPVA
jgi:hypothetical protein